MTKSRLQYRHRARLPGQDSAVHVLAEIALDARRVRVLRRFGRPLERMPAIVLEALPLVDRLFVVDKSEDGRVVRTVLPFDGGSPTHRAPDLPAAVATIFDDAIE